MPASATLDDACGVCVFYGCMYVLITSTDRALTIPSSIRGCQSGTWSAGRENIKGTSTKLQRERKDKDKANERNKKTKFKILSKDLDVEMRVSSCSLVWDADTPLMTGSRCSE